MKCDTEHLWFIAYKQHESVSECWLTVLRTNFSAIYEFMYNLGFDGVHEFKIMTKHRNNVPKDDCLSHSNRLLHARDSQPDRL